MSTGPWPRLADGSGTPGEARRVMPWDGPSPERMASELPEDAIADGPPGEGGRLARRLVVAFVMLALFAALCWGVLPRAGVYIPPMVSLGGFAIIAAASVASLLGRARGDREDAEGSTALSARGCGCPAPEGEPRPITCCGPRPPRAFRS